MSVQFRTEVRVRGPVSDGRALRAFDRFEEELRANVADRGAEEVGRETIVFVGPTGNYLRNITTTRRLDSNVVHLDNVVYGPWIEGTSQRNATSRFKGYQVFRRATQALDRRVDDIARQTIRPFLRDMNR